MKKVWGTLRICFCMFMARTFGEYYHSLNGPNQPTVAVYTWRGKDWWIPTTSVER